MEAARPARSRFTIRNMVGYDSTIMRVGHILKFQEAQYLGKCRFKSEVQYSAVCSVQRAVRVHAAYVRTRPLCVLYAPNHDASCPPVIPVIGDRTKNLSVTSLVSLSKLQ